MTTVRLLLAYDGTDFHGWAAQPGVRTVAGTLGGALGRVLGEPPRLSVAGRTDAGVHALGQVVSFEAPPTVDPGRLQRAVNGMLGPEVVVRSASRAAAGFDARRSSRARLYLYRIDTGPVPSPFSARFVWHRPGDLPIGRLRPAARLLVGEHDFRSFCRSQGSGARTIRTLRRLSVTRVGHEVQFRAEANAFLHQMVRSIVGTLVAVGEGRIDPKAMPEILAARMRSAAGPVAPPQGLALLHVTYGRS